MDMDTTIIIMDGYYGLSRGPQEAAQLLVQPDIYNIPDGFIKICQLCCMARLYCGAPCCLPTNHYLRHKCRGIKCAYLKKWPVAVKPRCTVHSDIGGILIVAETRPRGHQIRYSYGIPARPYMWNNRGRNNTVRNDSYIIFVILVWRRSCV